MSEKILRCLSDRKIALLKTENTKLKKDLREEKHSYFLRQTVWTTAQDDIRNLQREVTRFTKDNERLSGELNKANKRVEEHERILEDNPRVCVCDSDGPLQALRAKNG